MAAQHSRVLALGGLALLLVLVLSGCGRSEPTDTTDSKAATASTDVDQPSPETQTSEGGGVTIAATWRGPNAGPLFEVTMDTHSVDLDGYDLQELAVVRNDQGREAQSIGWDAPMGGHHREGTLNFPETAPDGSELISSNTRKIELVIRDVADVPERRFEWAL